MKYIISTLGCKVNQYETQAMETMLLEHGHEPAAPGEIADAVIVNTCAVTAESGRKSRQTIRRLRDENPGAVIAVCGCYSQLDPDAVAKTGADVVFLNGKTENFPVSGKIVPLRITVGLQHPVETAVGEINIIHQSSVPVPEDHTVCLHGNLLAVIKLQKFCAGLCCSR